MKLGIGQKVEASITRSGGKTVRIIGEVASTSSAFGREDIVIKNGKAEEFIVNIKNIKPLKTKG